jgi:hypothetical protein
MLGRYFNVCSGRRGLTDEPKSKLGRQAIMGTAAACEVQCGAANPVDDELDRVGLEWRETRVRDQEEAEQVIPMVI